MNRCPTCNSPAPHLHPSVQHGGEVELCTDDFHLTPTNENWPSVIADVLAKRTAKDSARTGSEG